MRRGQTPLNAAFRNPTVIGALAVLITVLTVFLAYNANNGLPFVPTYQLTAQVPDAANLVKGNDVRVGGSRVGLIERGHDCRPPTVVIVPPPVWAFIELSNFGLRSRPQSSRYCV